MDSVTLIIIIFIGAPVLVTILAFYALSRIKSGWMTEPIRIGHALNLINRVEIRPIEIVTGLTLILPIYVAGQLLFYGSWLFWLFAVYLCYRYLKSKLNIENPNPSAALTKIQNMAEQAKETDYLLQRMSVLLESRGLELSEMENVRADLEASVKQNKKDAEAWAAISEESKAAFISSLKKENSKGKFWRGFLYVVVGISLNLLATFIWVMSGNPGQDEIIQLFSYLQSKLTSK